MMYVWQMMMTCHYTGKLIWCMYGRWWWHVTIPGKLIWCMYGRWWWHVTIPGKLIWCMYGRWWWHVTIPGKLIWCMYGRWWWLYCSNLPEKKREKLLHNLDKDGDGKIDLEEFRQLFEKKWRANFLWRFSVIRIFLNQLFGLLGQSRVNNFLTFIHHNSYCIINKAQKVDQSIKFLDIQQNDRYKEIKD